MWFSMFIVLQVQTLYGSANGHAAAGAEMTSVVMWPRNVELSELIETDVKCVPYSLVYDG